MDSHWTVIGAYIAYLEIIKNLKPKFQKLKALKLDKKDFQVVPFDGSIEIDRYMYLTAPVKDSYICTIKNNEWIDNTVRTIYSNYSLKTGSFVDIPNFDQFVLYDNEKPYTLLVFGD